MPFQTTEAVYLGNIEEVAQGRSRYSQEGNHFDRKDVEKM